MKKIIGWLIICSFGLTSCTRVVQVVDRASIASESMPAVVEQKTDNFNIYYPTIWGKMTDKPMIKGYRLPRPTFGYGVYEISPAKLLTISVIAALIIKGLWSFLHKDTVNVIGNVTATPNGSFNAVASGDFNANAQGNFNAVPNGDFNANPRGNFEAVPNGEFQANAQGEFNAIPQGDFHAVPQGAFQVSHSNKKYNISPSSSLSSETKKKKVTPKILIDESDKSSDVKTPDKSDIPVEPPVDPPSD